MSKWHVKRMVKMVKTTTIVIPVFNMDLITAGKFINTFSENIEMHFHVLDQYFLNKKNINFYVKII